MNFVVVLEAIGFAVACFGLVVWGRRAPRGGGRSGLLFALLLVQAIVHLSDAVEWLGVDSLDRFGDDLRVLVPLAWLVLLFALRQEQTDRDLVGEREHTDFFLAEAPVAAVVLSRDGEARLVSREWAERSGVEPSELLGERLSEDLRGPASLVRHVLSTVGGREGSFGSETPLLVRWGERSEWVHWRAQGRPATPSRPSVVTLVVQVMTEEVLAENRERMDARALLEAHRVELVGQLAATVVHDLNNFLHAISAHAEYVDEHATPLELAQARSAILEAARSSSDLVRSLTGLARSKGATERIELESLVRSTASLMHRSMPFSIRLELQLTGGPHFIEGDRTRLQQALVNLIVNARDAMPNGGVLRVSLAGDAARAVLAVSDTGVGVPFELRERIFESFFTTKATQNGTGLGLSQVRAVVEEHHGELELESEVDRGTTFRLVLPRNRDERSAHRRIAPRRAAG